MDPRLCQKTLEFAARNRSERIGELRRRWKPLSRQEALCTLRLRRMQQNRVRLLPVAPSATRLLNVSLNGAGVIVVKNEPNLLLVHAHAESVRGDDDLDLPLHEQLLDVVPRRGRQA